MRALILISMLVSACVWAGDDGRVRDELGFFVKGEKFTCSIPNGMTGIDADLECRLNRPVAALQIHVPSTMCTYLYWVDTLNNQKVIDSKIVWTDGVGVNTTIQIKGNHFEAQCLDAAEDIQSRITLDFGPRN